jgi:hypothetical protein
LYKRNEAKFFGEKDEPRPSSNGSVYQQNAAHFYGYETPLHGERPFTQPPKLAPTAPAPKPVLAQRTMVNQKRDPKYEQNAVKFFGIEQEKPAAKQKYSYEQRLNKFIGH